MITKCDLRRLYAARYKDIIHDKDLYDLHKRVERFIDSVEDRLIKEIFTLRYLECLSWAQVALAIGGRNTPDSVRKSVERWLDRHHKRHLKDIQSGGTV